MSGRSLDESSEDLEIHEGCASAEEVRRLGRKIDRVLQILTESTDSRVSLMERMRQYDTALAEIIRQQRLGLLDHIIRQAAGTTVTILVSGVLLLVFKGFLLEIIAKAHP